MPNYILVKFEYVKVKREFKIQFQEHELLF